MVVATLIHEMVEDVEKSIEYDMCIVNDLARSRSRVKVLGGAKTAKRAPGRPRKKGNVPDAVMKRRDEYSAGVKGVARLKSLNSTKSAKKVRQDETSSEEDGEQNRKEKPSGSVAVTPGRPRKTRNVSTTQEIQRKVYSTSGSGVKTCASVQFREIDGCEEVA